MIVYNKKNSWKMQIDSDIQELEKYKSSYNNRIRLYNIYLSIIDVFKDGNIIKEGINVNEISSKIKVFESQVQKINNNINTLNGFLNNCNEDTKVIVEKKQVNKYNQKYREIRNNYINNSLLEENTALNFINGMLTDFIETLENMKQEHSKEIENILNEKNSTSNNVNIVENTIEQESSIDNNEEIKTQLNGISNNNTLLISEIEQKVVLPYTSQEVTEILYNNLNKYESEEDVIEDKFTRDFSEYKVQFASRYSEAIKLAKEREGLGFTDAISLATEMMGKRMLHPAIISACRSIDELDVYLDCLDKNELDDFKIFKIKYELYPMVVKQKRK